MYPGIVTIDPDILIKVWRLEWTVEIATACEMCCNGEKKHALYPCPRCRRLHTGSRFVFKPGYDWTRWAVVIKYEEIPSQYSRQAGRMDFSPATDIVIVKSFKYENPRFRETYGQVVPIFVAVPKKACTTQVERGDLTDEQYASTLDSIVESLGSQWRSFRNRSHAEWIDARHPDDLDREDEGDEADPATTAVARWHQSGDNGIVVATTLGNIHGGCEAGLPDVPAVHHGGQHLRKAIVAVSVTVTHLPAIINRHRFHGDRPMPESTYIALDLETTGLTVPPSTQIMEIGAVYGYGTEHVQYFQALVTSLTGKPSVPPEVERITGITSEMLAKDGLTPLQAMTAFVQWAKPLLTAETIWTSYNIPFDRKMLIHPAYGFGLKMAAAGFPLRWGKCTMELAALTLAGRGKEAMVFSTDRTPRVHFVKQTVAVEQLKVKPKIPSGIACTAHRALYDAICCAAIYKECEGRL